MTETLIVAEGSQRTGRTVRTVLPTAQLGYAEDPNCFSAQEAPVQMAMFENALGPYTRECFVV